MQSEAAAANELEGPQKGEPPSADVIVVTAGNMAMKEKYEQHLAALSGVVSRGDGDGCGPAWKLQVHPKASRGRARRSGCIEWRRNSASRAFPSRWNRIDHQPGNH